MKEGLELYIVACRSLHRATGPFIGLRSALTVAKQLTEMEGPEGCTYFPVPFAAQYKVVEMKEDAAPKTVRPKDHGYL